MHATRPNLGRSTRDASVASTVIRGEALRTPGRSTADVLSTVPGVEVTRTGARSDLATASLRGASSAQSPVYLGSVRINDDVLGTADLSTVPLFVLDRLEVYRGNAPERADRYGLGGAVFAEPRRARDTELLVGGGVGSFGERQLWTAGALAGTRSSLLVAVAHERADNDFSYVHDGGTRFDDTDDRTVKRENADFTSLDSWAIGHVDLGPGARLLVIANRFDRDQGAPGASVFGAERARADVSRSLGALSARLPCAAGSARGPDACTLELSTSALGATFVLDDPDSEVLATATRAESDGVRLVQQGRVQLRPSDAVSVSAGLLHGLETLHVHQNDSPTSNTRRSTSRAHAGATVTLGPKVGLHPLAAIECHTTQGPDGGDSCGVLEPTGRFGVSAVLSPTTRLLGNVGRFVRVPTLGELYGVSSAVQGNAALVPETGLSTDVGARYDRGGTDLRVTGEFMFFARWSRELVAYRRTSIDTIAPFNVSAARVLGAELLGTTELFRRVTLELTGTLMDPRDTTPDRTLDNDTLTFRSRLMASSLVEVHTPGPPLPLDLKRAAVGLRARHRASRFQDPAGLIVIPDQTTFDVESSMTLRTLSATLRLATRNVTGARQFDVIGRPLPGRSLHLSAEATW